MVILILFIYFLIWYIIAESKKNYGLIDIAWGLGFLVIAITSLIQNEFNMINIIVLFLISLWSIRLSYHLFKRNWNKEEDYRYQDMRKNLSGPKYITPFMKIFMPQLVLMLVISIPIYNFNKPTFELTNMLIIGIAIFIFGYIFESISDYQLKKFKEKQKGIMQAGLWKYSRHPNYFGESVIWWGLFIATFEYGGMINIFSPLLITYMLLYVSGVPLLEKKYENNAEFLEYKKHTSKFIPLPRRK